MRIMATSLFGTEKQEYFMVIANKEGEIHF